MTIKGSHEVNNVHVMLWVECCIASKGSSTLVKDQFGCLVSNNLDSLRNFFDKFASNQIE